MSSIGPQLPPHLQKRKRTPEDDDLPGSPPPKVSRRDYDDQIPLYDDSDDGFGPSAPSIDPSIGPSIGPSLPPPSTIVSNPPNPTVAKPSTGHSRPPVGPTKPPFNDDEIHLDASDSDEATGPAPPTASKPPSPPRRVIGPAPPPAPLSERPTTNPDPDSDSDDDYGPALPGSVHSRPTTHGPSLPSSYQPELSAPKRDSWMIAPPAETSYRAPDPTKLKARKFNTGPRAATESKSSSGGISSIWTETPEEKRRRLANAVLGRDDPSNTTAPQQQQQPSAGPPKRTAQDEAKIKAYTEQTRGKSLVEQHQARKAEKKAKGAARVDEEEDDPSKRAFSWEKDMKVGGVVSGKQKRELLNKAANFGGRFQKGSYL